MMPGDLSGEIMEISGLDQWGEPLPSTTLAQEGRDKPKEWSVTEWLSNNCVFLIGGAGLLFLGYYLGKKGVFRKTFEGLGIIKPCRTRDMRSGRRKRSQRWCLWDSKKKRVLGRHSSKKKAFRQEAAIKARQHA